MDSPNDFRQAPILLKGLAYGNRKTLEHQEYSGMA